MSSKYNPIINEEDDESDRQPDHPVSFKPGICVIINNTSFQAEEEFQRRKRDQDSQHVLFTTLGFKVNIHTNLTPDEMLEQMETYSNIDHEGVFVLSIIGRGNQNMVYCSNGQAIEISKLAAFFNSTNCSSLNGKEKIFVFDTCYRNERESFQPTSMSESFNDNIDDSIAVCTCTSKKESILTEKLIQEATEAKSDEDLFDTLMRVKEEVQKTQTIEVVNKLRKPYYYKRGTVMLSMQEKYTQFQEAVKIWAPIREKAIKDIEAKIEDLIKHRRNTNIAKVTGGATSIGGSILAVVGFALIPVTFGVSLGLGIGGVAIATAGGMTAAGASIADNVIQRCEKEVQALLDEDIEKLKPIRWLAEEMLKEIQETEEKCDGVDKKAIFEFFTLVIARGGTVGTKVAETVLIRVLEIGAPTLRVVGTAAIVVAIAGVVINADLIWIPIDMILIGITLKNVIGDKNASRAVENLRKQITELQEEKTKILKTVYTEEAQL